MLIVITKNRNCQDLLIVCNVRLRDNSIGIESHNMHDDCEYAMTSQDAKSPDRSSAFQHVTVNRN